MMHGHRNIKYGLHVSTHIELSSGPQDVDPDIQTFTASWDSQCLQSKQLCIIHNIKHKR